MKGVGSWMVAAAMVVTSALLWVSPIAVAGEVVLDFPSWQAEEPGFAEWWKGLIQEYEQTHPNVRIRLTQIPFRQYVDTLLVRFAANNPPDIVHLPTRDFSQFAAQGWLEPLDARMQNTDIPGNWTPLQQEMVWEGQTQGLLLLGYGFTLYYNDRLLKEAGLSVPKTPEEFLLAAKTLTKGDVFGFGTTTAEHPNVYTAAAAFIVGLGEDFVQGNRHAFSDPGVIKAVDFYRQVTRHAPKGVSTELARQLFFDGKVAMIMDGPWVLAGRANAAPEVKPHIRVAMPPFPRVPGSVSNSLHIAAATPRDRKQLVWEFIQLAASPKWQDRYALLTKSPPPRRDAVTPQTLASNPEMKLFSDAAAKAVSINPSPAYIRANYNEYSKTVTSAMMRLLTSNEDTSKVLADLQRELDRRIRP